ncbi:insulin receptor substrate 1-like [Gracilinanus agilis]|uniref:insulin receptor substrate 1-like n=1 Tax=Gracilinanus agilis TaxID=191870 RepID=UPI001CFD3FBB|nr:insulin receptor substrate 1-like [Gracilinanus agilis]
MEQGTCGTRVGATLESHSSADSRTVPLPWSCPTDVWLCGHLRKQKSQRLRFFVLRAEPPRLECYKSEKKFRATCAEKEPGLQGGTAVRPKWSVSLVGACTITKSADTRLGHLILLYTHYSSLGLAAASEEEQQTWFRAILELRAAAATTAIAAGGWSPDQDSGARDPAACQEVWPVTLRPKGLGLQTRSLGCGCYRLCLSSGALGLMRKPRETGEVWESGSPRRVPSLPPPALSLPLLSVRRCGHTDAFFFLELGRSAPTGPGELWLQAPDALVARNIHETVLDAMKRLGGTGLGTEQQLQGTSPAAPKSPALARPESPTTPAARAHRGQDYIQMSPPRAWGVAREESHAGSYALKAEVGLEPSGLGDYIAMEAEGDYVSMGGIEAKGYMVMGLPPTDTSLPNPPNRPLGNWGGSEYMTMDRSFPESPRNSSSSVPHYSEPQHRLIKLLPPGNPATCNDSQSGRCKHQDASKLTTPRALEPAEEYECIEGPVYLAMEAGRAEETPTANRESSLNYVDLDLPGQEGQSSQAQAQARPLVPTRGARPHTYAKIKFGRLGEEES